jgi:hypothetical protein
VIRALNLASPLRGGPRTRRVHQDASHHLGRDREEMRAILPPYVAGVYQAKVDLVDESRCLQRMACAFSPHVTQGHTV